MRKVMLFSAAAVVLLVVVSLSSCGFILPDDWYYELTVNNKTGKHVDLTYLVYHEGDLTEETTIAKPPEGMHIISEQLNEATVEYVIVDVIAEWDGGEWYYSTVFAEKDVGMADPLANFETVDIRPM